jgi:hypothetical protein
MCFFKDGSTIVYNPATNTSTHEMPMIQKLHAFAITMLECENVLVCGGIHMPDGNASASCEIFVVKSSVGLFLGKWVPWHNFLTAICSQFVADTNKVMDTWMFYPSLPIGQ